MKIVRLAFTVLAIVMLPASSPAFAHGHGFGHAGLRAASGHWHGSHRVVEWPLLSGFAGFWDWWPAYYGWGYGYSDLYVIASSPVLLATPSYYYCANPKGFFPEVTLCRQPWQAVPLTPQ